MYQQYCTAVQISDLLYMCRKKKHKADHGHKKGHAPRAQDGHSSTGISRPRTEVLRTRVYFSAANTLLRSRASRGHLNLFLVTCKKDERSTRRSTKLRELPSTHRPKKMARHEEESRLTLMRISVVEAANILTPEAQPIRPYVSIRVGSQLGQTKVSGGFKWGGLREGSSSNSASVSSGSISGRFRPSCSWCQSLDMIVRQHPANIDFEDMVSLRLMSYQVLVV